MITESDIKLDFMLPDHSWSFNNGICPQAPAPIHYSNTLPPLRIAGQATGDPKIREVLTQGAEQLKQIIAPESCYRRVILVGAEGTAKTTIINEMAHCNCPSEVEQHHRLAALGKQDHHQPQLPEGCLQDQIRKEGYAPSFVQSVLEGLVIEARELGPEEGTAMAALFDYSRLSEQEVKDLRLQEPVENQRQLTSHKRK